MTGSHFKVIQCVRYFWLIRICRGEIRHFLLSLFFYIMDNLVFINEFNDVLTDSLRVAVKFEKDHSKVIRSIDDLLEKSYVIDTECNPKMDLHKMFCLCYDDIPQPNGGFRKSKRYVMNRDGFTILVMGFTGSKAIKFKLEYMNAFNEMEASIKKNLPHNYIEALEALLVSEKEKQALAEAKKAAEEAKRISDNIIKEQAPKVGFPVVPLPATGSITASPGFVYVRIKYLSNSIGFWLGWMADFCLSVLNVMTDSGYLSVLSYVVRPALPYNSVSLHPALLEALDTFLT